MDTIEEILGKFLVQLEANGRSIHTIRQYERHIRLFAHWCREVGHSRNISKVSHQTIASFLSSTQAKTRSDGGVKKASSVNALRTSLRCFFDYCHKAGHIAENPSRLVRHALCGRPIPRILNKTEMDRLMEQMLQGKDPESQRDHALFHLLVATGIRLGSALALNIQDIDLEQGELWLQTVKGNRQERIYLSENISHHLTKFIGDRSSGPLFLSRQNKRISPRHVQRRFTMWLEKAGLPNNYTIHSLRHFFATNLYRKTGDLFLVKKALTHRSIVSTLVYTQVDEARLRQALEA